jgi:hypothetical protein
MYGEAKKDSRPFFRTNATLVIPNIVMQPALDEVQQGLNKAVQSIISVSKGVAQWSKERKRAPKVFRAYLSFSLILLALFNPEGSKANPQPPTPTNTLRSFN